MRVDVPFTIPKRHNGVMLLGEAPGEVEVEQGRGFVGPSGKLLDEMLVDSGLERRNCIIANVFTTRPRNNQLAQFFALKKQQGLDLATQMPTLNGMTLLREHFPHLQHLWRTIYRQHVRYVVGLGGTALWAITGETGIVARAGGMEPMHIRDHDFVFAPMFHPMYLARNRKAIPKQVKWLREVHKAL